jgi:transposase
MLVFLRMAFLRIEKKSSGTYLRIIQSYKQDGKVRHRTLYSLGKVEDYPADQLERIGKKLLELAGTSFQEMVTYQLSERARYNYGYPLVVQHLWQTFQLSAFFRRHLRGRRSTFDVENLLKRLLCDRLHEPVSKRASYYRQHDYIGLPAAALHQFYRALDVLEACAEPLQDHLYQQQRSLFSQQLDLVFYDVTTLYFESNQPQSEGDLRQKGYSKDGKAHRLQVVLGLLVDKLRNPIGYQLYEGNQYEGHTFKDQLNRLKKRYAIDKVIVVADRGMMNQKNRQLIEDESFDYIFGERLRKLPADLQEALIDRSAHQVFSGSPAEAGYTYRQLNYQQRRIICTYSERRARKDRYEREKQVEKAKKWINHPSKLTQKQRRGAGRFLIQQGKQPPRLDEQRIAREARFDGFLALATNRQDLAVEEVIEQYSNLYQVEHAFRTLKSTLDIRPMYHWTERRIRGHVALCFLSYLFLNTLEKRLGWTSGQLERVLDGMQVSLVEQSGDDQAFYLRSHLEEATRELVAKLKLVVPKDTTPQHLINQYFID